MRIRKTFTLDSAHIVRNCYSERCKYSLHAHTAFIETFITGTKVDSAGMLLDFGVTKIVFKPFLSLFENAVLIWKDDSDEYKNFVKSSTDNWIELMFTPSAELLSGFFQMNFNNLLSRCVLTNGEDPGLSVEKTRYHETRTGYGESDGPDTLDLVVDQKWVLCYQTLGPAVMAKQAEIESQQDWRIFGTESIVFEEPVQQVTRTTL